MTPEQQLMVLAETVCRQNLQTFNDWTKGEVYYVLRCDECYARVRLIATTPDKEQRALAEIKHVSSGDPGYEEPCPVGLAQRIVAKGGAV